MDVFAHFLISRSKMTMASSRLICLNIAANAVRGSGSLVRDSHRFSSALAGLGWLAK